MRRSGRVAGWVVLVLAGTVLLAQPAAADPPAPTDYRSEIVSVEPAVTGLELAVVGGDSFLELHAPPGREVVVVGYRGEAYLRFAPDGTVEENQRSPTKFANEQRFGGGDLPPEASAEAVPEWVTVNDGGRHAWHDHRTHWMNRSRPPGHEPGDVILEAVVPLLVDGDEVRVTVRSTWMPGPARWPVHLGFAAGLVLVGALAVASRSPAGVVVALVILGGAALAIGAVQVTSVPAETGPSRLLWLLPLFTLLLAAGSFALGVPSLRWSMVALAAAPLVLWAVLRIDGLWRAILPTDAPYGVDRFVTAMTLTGGAAAAAASVWGLRQALTSSPVEASTNSVGR